MKKQSINQYDDFEVAKASAHFEKCWVHCLHLECKKRRRCTGGPRGTWRKYGVPYCQIEGNCETPVTHRKALREPEVPWDEEPLKTVAWSVVTPRQTVI